MLLYRIFFSAPLSFKKYILLQHNQYHTIHTQHITNIEKFFFFVFFLQKYSIYTASLLLFFCILYILLLTPFTSRPIAQLYSHSFSIVRYFYVMLMSVCWFHLSFLCFIQRALSLWYVSLCVVWLHINSLECICHLLTFIRFVHQRFHSIRWLWVSLYAIVLNQIWCYSINKFIFTLVFSFPLRYVSSTHQFIGYKESISKVNTNNCAVSIFTTCTNIFSWINLNMCVWN